MGLDAHVHCDCFERGTLKTQPRAEWEIYIHKDGSRATTATDPDMVIAFEQWNDFQACHHEFGIALHHGIGNIALVALLRQHISQQPSRFPLILKKVIYNGTHCGDFLAIEEVEAIKPEVEQLSEIHSDDPKNEDFLRYFEVQMRELVDCALRLKKPLVF